MPGEPDQLPASQINSRRARSTPGEPDQCPASQINARRAGSTPGEPVPVRGRRIHYPTTFLNNVSTSFLNIVSQQRSSGPLRGPARPDRLARTGSPGPARPDRKRKRDATIPLFDDDADND